MAYHTFAFHSIKLDSVINARDLGGYVIPGAGTVRHGLLLRGGNLAQLSDSDMAKLTEKYRLAYIADFRSSVETRHFPDRQVPGTEYQWLPIADEKDSTPEEAAMYKELLADINNFILTYARVPKVQEAARNIYRAIITSEHSLSMYRQFMRKVVETEQGAIYFHCSQGKDRTGLGSAFILSALGADRDLILNDFDISNEFYKEDVARDIEFMKSHGMGEAEFNVIRTFVGVNVDYFKEALDMIDESYGSMDAFLHKALGMTDQDIETIRKRYLTK